MKNPNDNLIELNLSIIMDKDTINRYWSVRSHKINDQFCIMFMQTHQEILYLKEIFHNVHSRLPDTYNIYETTLHQ